MKDEIYTITLPNAIILGGASPLVYGVASFVAVGGRHAAAAVA